VRIYLQRHGEARWSNPDAQRRLTGAGNRAVEMVAAKLARPARIACSPYVRARETASIVGKYHNAMEVIGVSQRLLPGTPPTDATGELDQPELLCVTHQPLISRWIEFLTDEQVAMDPAWVAVLEAPGYGAGCARLIEVITP
jgi:phosphohistidine phosphatase SixA